MNDAQPQASPQSTLLQAYQTIKQLRAELQAVRQRPPREPIAIIGMACRFPGASDPDAFWQMLVEGRDAVGTLPAERWDISGLYDPTPGTPNKIYVRAGAFLNQSVLEGFDADFFGISPREALSMDPLQRLALEVAWEALERAGIVPATLRDSRTGIFMGSGYAFNEYGIAHLERLRFDPYFNTGTDACYVAGRLAYELGTQGPALVVATACSSSLVAIHLACRALQAGECNLALAGAAHLNLTIENIISGCQLHTYAPDGYSKAFDVAADGYGLGEGAGVIVLKRLADAEREGTPILAVIRGSAVNHDGPSAGLTVPNGVSQEAVLRQALADAHVQPADIGYIETHGTGTSLGDPIEAYALGAVFAEREAPLYIGSVKANIGHLETAAGVAGVIKTVQALQHQILPRSPHCETLNPHIAWDSLPLDVVRQTQPWKQERRMAGISGFGLSGTNAHVILGAAPVRETLVHADAPTPPALLLPLAAKTDAALRDLARAYASHLAAHTEVRLADVCYTAATRRSHFAHRLALVASDAVMMQQHLAAVAAGDSGVGITGAAPRTRAKVAFLFTGQGSQYAGMGRRLYATQPTFRDTLDTCATLLQAHLDVPLLEVLFDDDSERLHQTRYTQPALFALEYALAQLWMAWGIKPDYLLGHSIGEYVAACLAGVFSLNDALTLVAARGRLMQALPQTGQMVAIQATPERVAAAIQSYAAQVALAAINSPRSVVIAGETSTVQTLAARFEADGLKTRVLQTSHAFHSPLMEPMLDAFGAVARQIIYHPAQLPVASNVSGQIAGDELTDPDYWVRHVRQPVQFAAGMATLAAARVTAYLEVGPHPALTVLGQQCLPDEQVEHSTWAPSLHREREDWQQMLTSLGQLYVAGVSVDWHAVYPPDQHQRVDLPTYPFQHQRYWMAAPARRVQRQVRPLLDTMARSPLIGGTLFETEVSTATLPWLADHQVFGNVVMPGAGSLAMLLSAAEVLWETPAVQVCDVVLPQPLVLPDGQARSVHLLLQPAPTHNGTSSAEAQLVSLPTGASSDTDPTPHLTGSASPAQPLPPMDLTALQARCTTAVDLAYITSDSNVLFGPTFRWLTEVWRGEGEALARLVQPDALDSTDGYLMHPALLDACFQLCEQTLPDSSETLLPFAVDTLTLVAPAHPGNTWWAHARQTRERRWDLTLFNEAGQVLAFVAGFQMRAATTNAVLAQQQIASWLYTLAWREQPLSPAKAVAAGRWLVVETRRRGDEEARGADHPIWEALQRRGQACVTVAADDRNVLEAVLTDGTPFQGVIYLADSPDGDPDGIPDQAEAIYTGALHLAQALVRHGHAPRLWLVTRGTQLVQDGEAIQVSGSVLWGLGRTLGYEHPELTASLIDLPALPAADEFAWISAEVLAATPETQVAYRAGQRFVARLVRYQQPARPSGPFCVELPEYGTLDGLRLAPMQRRAPEAGEVEIDIQAAALNFRDVLRALGMLRPYEAADAPTTNIRLGFECAGVVAAVGDGVRDLHVGDRVLAITSYGSLASCITTSATNVVPIPHRLSFIEATTLPVAFATAAYSLHWLADLAPGERILIHAAAGGVGQAAVQLARAIGAEVFATASPAKWEFLRQQGIQHIFNSRTLDFAEQVLVATDGRGVDVVLNSLTGDFIPQSFAALARGGRFVEIGKVGIWSPDEARAHRPDVTYLPFDLDEEQIRHSLSLRDLLAPIVEHLAVGQVQPLPHTTFPVTRIQEAFRFMQQGRHIGKVVITMPEAAPIQPDASYLITGGLGGLGLTIARGLVTQGARHLILSGRSGATSEDARQTIADLEQQGVTVQVIPADIAQRDAVARLLATAHTQAPLRGIIHAAGVLDDGILLQQTPERYQTVAAPKVVGGWHLHTLTRAMPLDFLVLFSSASSLLGSAGQANYAAANAFMDSLALARQAQHLPALSINWGAWAQVGLAAQRASAGRMTITGAISLTPEQGAAAFQMLLQEQGQVGVVPGLEQQIGSHTPFVQEILRPVALSPVSGSAVRQRLAQATAGERRALLEQHVQQQIGMVLGRSAGVPLDEGFFDLGMDSLMAVELRNALQKSLECKLPGTLTFDYPTGNALVGYLMQEVLRDLFVGEDTEETAAEQDDRTDHIQVAVDALSDSEVDDLLIAELERLGIPENKGTENI